jgi:hypothetical protein
MPEAPQQRLRIGEDIRGEPVVAWQTPDGRFMCAWIELAHEGSGTRCIFTGETDGLGGKLKAEPTGAPLYRSGDDLDALIAFAEAHGAVGDDAEKS